MNKIQTFQEFLATSSVQVPVVSFTLNMCLAILLSILLGYLYTRYGRSLSNRKMFSKNLLMLTVTTMFVISVVKSSLALSLGLVGALSIVRFRAAIKEPEELIYLFFAIGIGLGLGADQRIITIVAFSIVAAITMLRESFSNKNNQNNLHLTISSFNAEKLGLQQIVDTLNTHVESLKINRFDEVKNTIEATFLVEFKDFESLNNAKDALKNLDPEAQITFLDNQGIL
jgi:uncharacterized membrane protein YhiD involved in acid resistance